MLGESKTSPIVLQLTSPSIAIASASASGKDSSSSSSDPEDDHQDEREDVVSSRKDLDESKQAQILLASSGLVFGNISYHLQQGKGKNQKQLCLLKNASGYVRHGEVLAIMGPSGAGKTTLMKVLAGRLTDGTPSGSLFLNDEQVNYSLSATRMAAYVEQEALLIEYMTVLAFLTYCANLTLPSTMDRKAQAARVTAVLSSLRLDHVAGTLISRLSSGQRKRVGIASDALLLDLRSKTIFLDEPTSGLSASDASDLMHLLSQMARNEGYAIILTIHQPRESIIANYVDRLVLMSPFHTVIYVGPPSKLRDTFTEWGYVLPAGNLLDETLDKMSQMTDLQVHDLRAKFLKSSLGQEVQRELTAAAARTSRVCVDDAAAALVDFPSANFSDVPASPASHSVRSLNNDPPLFKETSKVLPPLSPPFRSSISQICTLSFSKLWLIIKRLCSLVFVIDRTAVIYPLFFHTIYVLLTAFLFYDLPITESAARDRLSGIVVIITLGNSALASWCYTYVDERPRINKEISLGYYTIESHIAWFIVVGVRCLMYSIVQMSVYWIMGMKADAGFFFLALLHCFLWSWFCAASLQSHLIWGASPDVATARYVAILTYFTATAGFFVLEDNIVIFLRWSVQINPLRAGFQSIAVNEFSDLVFQCDAAAFNSAGQQVQPCPIDGSTLISLYQLDDRQGIDILILCVYLLLCFIFHLIHAIKLSHQFQKAKIDSLQACVLEDAVVAAIAVSDTESARSLPYLSLDVIAATYASTSVEEIKTPNSRSSSLAGISISFSDISVQVYDRAGQKGRKTLISDVWGVAPAGKLTAIVGPSGAGKSTLLLVLAHRKLKGVAAFHGTLSVNGEVIHSRRALNKHLVYVPHSDLLAPWLTVRETFDEAAALQLPREWTPQQRAERVASAIGGLHLQETLHTPVSKLSGGERRRVSIGVSALLLEKSVILLDEPTTGLSSADAAQLLELLHKLAVTRCYTIVLSIHQPRRSIFLHAIDRLLVLDQRTIWYGEPPSAVGELRLCHAVGVHSEEFSNPSDDIMDWLGSASAEEKQHVAKTAYEQRAAQWLSNSPADESRKSVSPRSAGVDDLAAQPSEDRSRAFSESRVSATSNPGRNALEAVPTPGASALTQFRYLFYRYWTLTLRESASVRKLFSQSLIAFPFLFGIMFIGLPHDTSSAWSFFGALDNAITFFMFVIQGQVFFYDTTMNLIKQEVHAGKYYLSVVMLVETVIMWTRILVAVTCVSYVWFLVGYNDSPAPFFQFLGILLLGCLLVDSLTLVLAYLSRGAKVAMYIAPPLLMLMNRYDGFWVQLYNMPSFMRWLSDISITRYLLEMATNAAFDGQTYSCSSSDSVYVISCPIIGDNIVTSVFGYSSDNLDIFYDALGLCLLLIGLRFLAYVSFHLVMLGVRWDSVSCCRSQRNSATRFRRASVSTGGSPYSPPASPRSIVL